MLLFVQKVLVLKFSDSFFFYYLIRVRFHYGHPDVFDRIFHITRGGISKASRGVNLSEDIFAGDFPMISLLL